MGGRRGREGRKGQHVNNFQSSCIVYKLAERARAASALVGPWTLHIGELPHPLANRQISSATICDICAEVSCCEVAPKPGQWVERRMFFLPSLCRMTLLKYVNPLARALRRNSFTFKLNLNCLGITLTFQNQGSGYTGWETEYRYGRWLRKRKVIEENPDGISST